MSVKFLNEQQEKAVKDTEGAVLVFAGAGSGKTRVLTHRIVYLIEEKKVNPWNILAITFTNKATSEMKTRLNDMLGENGVWVSTFHSLCTRILFNYADRIGYDKNFSIYDEVGTKKIMQRIMREKHLDEDKEMPKLINHIANAKNKGLSPTEYSKLLTEGFYKKGEEELITEVYERYDELLKENNAMDFDDLLIRTKELLISCEDVKEYYQNKFRYVHVDEFQDTNEVQFELVKLFSGKHKNVFVVGDDDQSIYGWRGANVDNILNFDKTYPDAKIYKLEQNYRSTQAILDCANNLIKNNHKRSEKSLFTDKKSGVRVEYLINANEYDEASRVLDTIRTLKRVEGYNNSDIAILVRNNHLTRVFESGLNKTGISYKVFGGFKFFDRKEVQDVIAYMRVIANPKDSEALGRIINVPKRGIGDSTVASLESYAANHKIPLYEAIVNIDANTELSQAVKNKIRPFRDLMEGLKYESIQNKFYDFAKKLVEEVGFEEYYTSTNKEEDINRFENIKELITHIKENFGEEEANLESFLHSVSLDRGADENFDTDNLVLATMHSAKGLEFKVVFIVACEDGIIPSKMCFSEANGIEEERRVMYVAVTRAQERLYISSVNGTRSKFGSYERAVPSRFVSESKGEKVRKITEDSYFEKRYQSDDFDCAIPKNHQMREISSYSAPKQVEEPKKVYNESAKGFVSGAKVEHKKYGKGTVIIVEGAGQGTTVTVAFPSLGIKKFAVANAPIKLV